MPEELKAWREQHGLTQPRLADLLGVHRMTIYKYESGKAKIPPYLHLALAELERRMHRRGGTADE